jgi:hypothetical protein
LHGIGDSLHRFELAGSLPASHATVFDNGAGEVMIRANIHSFSKTLDEPRAILS